MQVISPLSMSGVVLDAPEATLLLSTIADHLFVKRSSEDDSRTGSPCPKI
jgi:hypothetical protein